MFVDQLNDRSGDGMSQVNVMKKFMTVVLPAMVFAAVSFTAVADDVDIYDSSRALQQLNVKPNLLFVLDSSGSMAWNINNDNDTTPPIRIDIMKGVLNSFLTDANLQQKANVGLMRFNDSSGSVVYPVSPLDVHSANLVSAVNLHFTPSGGTPGVTTLSEAVRYMLGQDVLHGLVRPPAGGSGGNRSYYRISHADSMASEVYQANGCTPANINTSACRSERYSLTPQPVYTSPITHQCQKNHVVLLTDGFANETVNETVIKSLIGMPAATACDRAGTDSACGVDIARFFNQNLDYNDLPADRAPVNNLLTEGNQGITIHTIGLKVQDQWLQDVAAAGGGLYRRATDSATLLQAFQDILNSATDINGTFAAPSATVNQVNRLNHRDDIFFALFKPNTSARWPGNIKKYKLRSLQAIDSSGNLVVDANGDPVYETVIVDRTGSRAVDSSIGFFKDDSRDFWSTGGCPMVQDPNDNTPPFDMICEFNVEEGGAVEQLLNTGTRNIYSWFTGHSNILTATENRMSYNSTLPADTADDGNTVDDTMLGVAPGTGQELIDWANGLDVYDIDNDSGATTTNRKQMGDPLHSRPAVVTYVTDPLNDSNTQLAMFYGSNEGYLHALDGTTGEEIWSFMPQEMIPNIKNLVVNGTARHIYGVDGTPTVWVKDNNRDGTIDPSDLDANGDGDHVYLYFGFRRGGTSYYALDVTNRNSPRRLWSISRGDTGFAELGETWSQPARGRVRTSAGDRDVIFFTGGYDPAQDDDSDVVANFADTQGRAIYMVDAITGALLWSADFSNVAAMQYSMPANIAVIDPGQTGYATQLYVPDMGGQVWRFDINNGAALNSSFITPRLVAQLSEPTLANNAGARRFYQGVDIGILRENNIDYLAVALGSGWRAKPNETDVANNFYVLKVPNPYTPLPASFTTITRSDLFDTTDNSIGEGTSSVVQAAQTALTNSKGWFIRMENTGEKVLSTPLIFEGQVVWTTYEPTAQLQDCVIQPGTSRAYIVHLNNGTPTRDSNDDNFLLKNDRTVELQTGSIVDQPIVVFVPDAKILLGPEDLGPLPDRVNRTFWYDKE